jgi:hypothetical protein
MNVSSVCRIVGASLLGLVAQAAAAQSRPPTTEQLGRDPGALRQEAEQQRAQQQRDQQRQSQQQADQQYNDALRQQQSRAAGDMAQAEAVRRTWQQRPPLAPEKNPLLGRWESLGAGQRKGSAPGLSPEMAQLANALIGSLTSGLCDSMLGRGNDRVPPCGPGRDRRRRPRAADVSRRVPRRRLPRGRAAAGRHDIHAHDHRLRRRRPRERRHGRLRPRTRRRQLYAGTSQGRALTVALAHRWRATTEQAIALAHSRQCPHHSRPIDEGAHDSARMTEIPLMSSLFISTID